MKRVQSWGVARVAAAGTAGGAAEVLWIAAIAGLLGIEGERIAQAVTATALPPLAHDGWAPWLGLGIHFLLSLALAAAFVPLVARRLRGTALVSAAIAVLALVWAFNFMILLPVLNPQFAVLLPLPATLASKLLFGGTMGAVLAVRGLPGEAPPTGGSHA